MEKVFQKNIYSLQWETHPKHTFKSLCSLMEHQSLVDIAICCGNNTLHAHKCILAASSAYFRNELEKNASVEQIVMTGFDFAVLKSLIEFIYCGVTNIAEEHIKYLIGAAKLFQVRGLDILFADRQEYQHMADDVYIPYPQFITNKPKYPMAFHPFNAPLPGNVLKPTMTYNIMDQNLRKLKRKHIRTEAEKACAKEAQASRMALANLQKEIASAPQVNSFIIEETCTETTVENFIPNTEDNFENLNVQVVNYSDLDNNVYIEDTKPPNMIHFAQNQADLTADKLKHFLGTDIPPNVEIMFKTSEGNYVSVTDEVLQNISKGGLQYQVVDENGHVGDLQDLKVMERDKQKLKANKTPNLNKENIPPSTSLVAGAKDENFELKKTKTESKHPINYVLFNNSVFDAAEIRTTLPPDFNTFQNKIVLSDLNNATEFLKLPQNLETESNKKNFSPDIFFASSPPSASMEERCEKNKTVEKKEGQPEDLELANHLKNKEANDK